ncbi:MAG: hypothetical protein R2932_23800 [Caldilineaceae bacterium]
MAIPSIVGVYIGLGAVTVGGTRTSRCPQVVEAPSGTTVVQLNSSAAGVTVNWPNPDMASAAATTATLAQLPTIRYQGYELPMKVFMVALPDATVYAAAENNLIDVQTLTTLPWSEPIPQTGPDQPPVIDWESYVDPLRPPDRVALPAAPLVLLRQGNLHGQRVAVYALSPIYKDGDTVKFATALSATIQRAKPIDPADHTILSVRDLVWDQQGTQAQSDD